MEKRWEIAKPVSKDLREQLLINRSLESEKDREKFLHPHFTQFSAAEELFPEVKKVLLRLKKAVKEKELIYIYGDYDVDGLTASAILWETITSLGGNVMPYIPSRHEEGYGLHNEALEKISALGAKIVITVDCGITAIEQAKVAKKLGLELIITDHHQPQEKLPSAYAILHTTTLAGSGVAFRLGSSLLEEFGKETSAQFMKNLELATLGTVADMVPLTQENRIIVKNGLVTLGNTERTGLLAMYQEAGIGKNIDTYDIGHIISPRLNAMGRMESALDSLRLLLTKKKERADSLAKKLSSTNKERQVSTQKALENAKEKVEKDYKGGKLFVIASKDYHEGIVGLVAGRIVDAYYRPTAVISDMGLVSKGSARSIRGFNITEAIHKNSEMLLAHGGHPMAAGFSITAENIPQFREKMIREAEDLIKPADLVPKIKIDAEVSTDQVNEDLNTIIKEFEPFGIGNTEPVFLIKKIKVTEARLVGVSRNHLRLVFSDQKGKVFSGIGFGLGEKQIKENDVVDVVFNLRENIWNGRKRLEFRVLDIKKAT